MATKERKLLNLKHLSRKGLILHLITATGILRSSFPSPKARARYRKAAPKVIEKLLDKVDRGTLTNRSIWKGILELKGKAGCSVGLSQKSINVVLKYYCFASNANHKLLKILDCPVDGRIISHYYKSGSHKSEFRLLNLGEKNYKIIQDLIEKAEGIRILGDLVYEKEYLTSSPKHSKTRA